MNAPVKIDAPLALRDLVKVHLVNKARCLAAAEAFARCEPGSREEYARAEDAQESSRSDLACAIEDLFCVSADELGRALS